MGLVNKVVPAGELDAVAEEWGRRLAAGPTLALGLSKRLLDASSSVTFEQALEDEARCQHITYTSKDMREGIAAFLERREPRFSGSLNPRWAQCAGCSGPGEAREDGLRSIRARSAGVDALERLADARAQLARARRRRATRAPRATASRAPRRAGAPSPPWARARPA